MKPLWTLSILLTLLVALGCSKDEEPKTDGEGGDQASANGGDTSGGAGGNQAMGPDGGQGIGGDDGGFGGEEGGLGGGEGGFGGGAPKKSKQPPIDPNAPAGKRQLWTYGSGQADIVKIYVGKSAEILATAFGQPASWKKQGNYLIYTYDKMRVKGAQNMQYSKVHFDVLPNPKGGGKVMRVRLDPASGVKVQPAGGIGGEGFPGGGLGGEGIPGEGLEGNPGGGPAPL